MILFSFAEIDLIEFCKSIFEKFVDSDLLFFIASLFITFWEFLLESSCLWINISNFFLSGVTSFFNFSPNVIVFFNSKTRRFE
jgi:hypothetical protein